MRSPWLSTSADTLTEDLRADRQTIAQAAHLPIDAPEVQPGYPADFDAHGRRSSSDSTASAEGFFVVGGRRVDDHAVEV